MLNDKIKGAVIGLLVGSTLTGGAVFAKTESQMIEAVYSDIKLYVNGIMVNTSNNEPFIYEGTTYLPVRAVGEALGQSVEWDGLEKIVYLGAKPGEQEGWMTQCKPYQYSYGKEYKFDDNEFFTMSGQKYTNGFVLSEGYDEFSEALFNLNSRYNSVTFTVGHIDNTENRNVTMNVYLDGVTAYTKELKYDDVAKKLTVPLNGALQMKIEIVNGWGSSWGFSEGMFE